MKRTLMQIYVRGSIEAVEFYKKAFDATLGYHELRPDGAFYHAELDLCGQVIAVAEASESLVEPICGNTMQFCLHYGRGNENAVRKAYETLQEGGEVLFPLGPCSFSPLVTDVIDKYKVHWCIFV